MTLVAKQADIVLRTWQERLCLKHWTIKFDAENAIPKEEEGAEVYARMWRPRDYNTGELQLMEGWQEWSVFTLNVNIVHELLHLATREIEFILDQLEDLLQKDVDNLIAAGHRHAVEGSIDFLAYRFVELGGVVGHLPEEE